jgi:hypothetical protein
VIGPSTLEKRGLQQQLLLRKLRPSILKDSLTIFNKTEEKFSILNNAPKNIRLCEDRSGLFLVNACEELEIENERKFRILSFRSLKRVINHTKKCIII